MLSRTDQPIQEDNDTLLQREASLATLAHALAMLDEGAGGVVSISGEAGIGKTTLIRAFAKPLFGVRPVLLGGCEELSTSRPFGPLFDMVQALGDDFVSLLTQETTPSNVVNHLLIWLQRNARPVVMVIEDMHWADDATLDLVKVLARRAASLPLLLILTHRNDEPGREHPISRILGAISRPDLTRIELEPFTVETVRRLFAGASKTAQRIHEITNGNPFFVTEILARADNETQKTPESVRDAIWARLEKLPIEQRITLEALSIMPGGCERALLEALITTPQAEQIDALVQSAMLIADGSRIRFRHELARLAVIELLQVSRKRKLHEATVAWLANSPSSSTLDVMAQRIHHAEAAGMANVVVELAPLLAERSAQLGAHKQAAQFLALALGHSELLDAEARAQMHESWSYEAGLAIQIDGKVIEARHKAIDLWQRLGRLDKVGLNYRWLSRLHWYLGDAVEAENYIKLAVETLESIEPQPELAWSYSVRSQWAMLNDQFDDAIEWGTKAIEFAKKFSEPEIRAHALNNIGTSKMLRGEVDEGRSLMDESLSISLQHGFHEQAARVYTNMAEYALAARDMAMAEHYLVEGIAFDTDHDLDSWVHYLRGCHARFLMMRGALKEAEALALDVLSVPYQTKVMQLPGKTVLAHVRLRMGNENAAEELHDVLVDALATKEPQRIAPVRIALAEAAWLSGDDIEVRRQVEASFAEGSASHNWDIAELSLWACRAGVRLALQKADNPDVIQAELDGDPSAAAEGYRKLGLPFDQAIALLCASKTNPANAEKMIRKAAGIFRDIEAANAYKLAETMADASGFDLQSEPAKRGPYSAARVHPFNLTAKEQIVLEHLMSGLSNAAIAAAMSRSVRTVEHHVANIMSKMGVHSRYELLKTRKH